MFRRIHDIAELDLTKLPRKEVIQLKYDLHDAFYHTSLRDGVGKSGKPIKVEIGDQLTRVSDFLMSPRVAESKCKS